MLKTSPGPLQTQDPASHYPSAQSVCLSPPQMESQSPPWWKSHCEKARPLAPGSLPTSQAIIARIVFVVFLPNLLLHLSGMHALCHPFIHPLPSPHPPRHLKLLSTAQGCTFQGETICHRIIRFGLCFPFAPFPYIELIVSFCVCH